MSDHSLVIPDGDSVPYHIIKALEKAGIVYRWVENERRYEEDC